MLLPPPGHTIFTPKSVSLTELLTGIHTQKIALPEFQRPWVWEPEMIRDLIISVAYCYPAGSLLTMPTTGGKFALRPFSGVAEILVENPTLMVLDGQQRLTSLYQALYKQNGVQVNNRTYYFYLDIKVLISNFDSDTNNFEKSLFYVTEDRQSKQVRYDKLQPMYELATYEQRLRAGALPLNCIFAPNDSLSNWKTAYLIQQAGKDMDHFLELSSKWDQLVQTWLNRIRLYLFPVIDLNGNMPLEAICHIFEKVNSTGVALNVFDLCTAILWAQSFDLNKEWANTRKNLAKSLTMQPLSGTYFLQGIALLESLSQKRANPGERIAVSCRKENLMALKADILKRWWDVQIEGYKEAAIFMANQGILSERILPYSTLILPLSTIFSDIIHRKGKVYIGVAWVKIEQWYWCSVFSQRYSSQVETVAAQDFEQVIAWIDGGKQPDAVSTFSFRSDVLQEITSIRNAIYKGVLCLLARNGAKDFDGKGKVSIAIFHETRYDHHHIFPTDALKQLGISNGQANTIVNKTLIGASVNRSIGGHLPSEYIQTWRKKLGSSVFDDILATHAIDASILSTDQWEAFVLDRREKLRLLIESVCGGNVQQFVESNANHAVVNDIEDEEEVLYTD